MAVEHPPAALVLRSPFTSLVDVGRVHYPFLPIKWLLTDRFTSLNRIGGVTCPVLVIAGDNDQIVPLAQSQRLYASVRSRKQLEIMAGANHNDPALANGDALIAVVTQFLSSA